MSIETYADALAFIHGRPRVKKQPTLARMRDFLAALGHPEAGQTYLHVTGTNGKGSVVAMSAAMLAASGLTVGTFTSPFITRFNERIAINGQPISDADLVKYTQQVTPIVAAMDASRPEGGPLEFEVDLAIAFLYFQAQAPDVVILEVGIGGRWDYTNVIDPVAVAIVTVGYDHMALLGSTLTEIATHKAGIIKPHRPVVVGQLPAEAMAVVEQTAQQLASPLLRLGQEFHARSGQPGALFGQLQFQGPDVPSLTAALGLAGEYQVQNAAVAVQLVTTYLTAQHLPIDPRALKTGLAQVQWPGRLEVVNDEPLMLLDGAHNLPGVQALVQTLQTDLADREIYLLVGILADKQAELMLGELASLKNVHLYLTHFAGPSQQRPSADLADLMSDIPTRYPVHQAPDWQTGLYEISQTMSADEIILITGSLYFVSEVRNFLKD